MDTKKQKLIEDYVSKDKLIEDDDIHTAIEKPEEKLIPNLSTLPPESNKTELNDLSSWNYKEIRETLNDKSAGMFCS